MYRISNLYLLLFLTLIFMCTACAHKQVKQTIWRIDIKRCVKNNDHWVCECGNMHQVLNVKNKQYVTVCD